MCHSDNKKLKKSNKGKNRTAKWRKNENTREEENSKHLGISKSNTIKQAEMEEKFTKEYLKRMRKILETNSAIEISLKE